MNYGNDLIRTVIKKREDQYLLVTENELANIKKNTAFSDVMLFLATIFLGLFIERWYLEPKELRPEFLVPGCIFFILWLFIVFSKLSPFRHPETSSPILPNTSPDENGLEILSAIYGTPTNAIDITKRLNEFVKDGKIETIVTNAISNVDPHPGSHKTLKIFYKYNGVVAQKEVKEYDKLQLP